MNKIHLLFERQHTRSRAQHETVAKALHALGAPRLPDSVSSPTWEIDLETHRVAAKKDRVAENAVFVSPGNPEEPEHLQA